MTKVDHLGAGADGLDEIVRRIGDSAVATPLASASVERGRIRMYAGSQLLIEDGNLTVSGTATVTGTLTGGGTFSWTGPVTLTGATHLQGNTDITGTLAVSGATTITNTLATTGATTIGGTLQVTGATTLKNDLTVTTGGKIKAGATVFNPDGSLSSSSLLSIVGSAGISLSGTTSVGGTLTAASAFINTGISTSTLGANIYIDPTTKQFYWISSARRFKIRPRKMKVAPGLLDVPIKEWIDRGARKRGEPDVHIPGVIAEEVNAAGGGQFVTHDENGKIAGVAYDRLALARTELLNMKLDAALKEIDALKTKLAAQG